MMTVDGGSLPLAALGAVLLVGMGASALLTWWFSRRRWKVAGEMRFRRSQEHLTCAQRIARTGSIEQDLKAGAVEWSVEAFTILGLDPDGPPPSRAKLLELVHPDDRDKFEAVTNTWHDALSVGAAVECRITRPDGEPRWIRHESDVFFDAKGQPIRRIGIFQDVTEAHEIAERQKEMQDALSAAVETAADANAALRMVNEELLGQIRELTAAQRASLPWLNAEDRLSPVAQAFRFKASAASAEADIPVFSPDP